MTLNNKLWDFEDRLFGAPGSSPVVSLADGEAAVINTTGMSVLSIITSATVTYSQVDTFDASSHDAATQSVVSTNTVVDVEWPYYRVSVSGGTARVCAV